MPQRSKSRRKTFLHKTMRGIHTHPEVLGKIRAMTRQGISGRQIARELNIPASTVARLIADVLIAIPKKRVKLASETNRINKNAIADYSKAKYTRLELPTHPHIVCNSLMRERYVPNELQYRRSA